MSIEFLKLHGTEIPEICILDIGAMLIGQEPKEYSVLVEAGIAKVIGFEPVQSECDRLNMEYTDKRAQYLPYFIGDGTRQTFRLNNFSMTSSLYEPNTPLLSLFNNLSELTTTVNREDVQTTCLDDIKEINFPVDYIKIDIQGAELQAFCGGKRLLADTVVIQTEVEWVPLYQRQPLFSEIEQELRQQGFLMHRILGFGTRAFKPLVFNNDVNTGSQQLWSDVVFVRDFTRLDLLSERQLLSYIVTMYEIYKAFDITAHLFDELGKRRGKELKESYIKWLVSANK